MSRSSADSLRMRFTPRSISLAILRGLMGFMCLSTAYSADDSFYYYHLHPQETLETLEFSLGISREKISQKLFAKGRSLKFSKQFVAHTCNLWLLRNTILVKKRLKTKTEQEKFLKKHPNCQNQGPEVLSDPYQIQLALKLQHEEVSPLNYWKILEEIQ